jgi:acid phosphatase family membrane protein YuiD
LIVAATVGIGLHDGFDTSLFAIALATAMVVVYDAAGVRQQAGVHAQKINVLVNELLSGHPISDKDLREVLGHTPLEVAGGILLGTIVSTLAWMYTK